jgi:protein dithiol oxidoreductase (disulfide-forming)
MKMVKLLSSLTLGLMLIGGMARAEAPAGAKGYDNINPPQATQNVNKVEIVEVFWYGCPHCHGFDPAINAWVKNLPKEAEFRRMHVVWGEDARILPHAKLFFALESMGLLESLHTKVFDAIHVENQNFNNPERLFDWIEKQGVNRKEFQSAYNSFGVMSKVGKARELTKAYGVNGVPVLVVDGKYLVTTRSAGSNEGMLAVAEKLVQTAMAERPRVAEPAIPTKPPAKKVSKRHLSQEHAGLKKPAMQQVAVQQ